jgi:hypothetical protein
VGFENRLPGGNVEKKCDYKIIEMLLERVKPQTDADSETKSRSLELLPNRITSAETKAWICTADDCFNVMPQFHKT